jgi:DNA polymerase (family X)
MEFKIRLGLNNIKRVLWWEAEDEAIAFKAFIEGIAGVKRCEVAGSFRRRRETVGSLRFVVECSSPAGVLKSLEGHAAVEKIIEKKKERVAFRLASGPQLVVRFAEKASWGDSMIAETGSLAHVEAVEKSSGAALRRKKFRSEEEWYAARDLQFFEPELREGRGENEFDIGELVTLDDIKGDLHMHTTASDGVNTIPEMAAAAKKRGYSYIAISDHSRSLKITNGLDIKRLRKQIAEIKEFNSTSKGLHVFAASEVDILEDGELDYPDEVLSELDIVICSIHSRFNLDKKKQTARVVKAMSNRYATFLGHMTGRLLLRRPGYELDTDLILKTIHDNGKYVEINSSPDRLDIDDSTAIEARKMGLPIVVNTDAHSIRELDFMKLGVQQARRGWQRAIDVLNTLPLAKLKKRLNDVRG